MYLSGYVLGDRRRINGWRGMAHATGVLTECWRRSRRDRPTPAGTNSLIA
jgi:hypothetical protein